MVSAADIDEHVKTLSNEIVALRSRKEHWAQVKADAFEKMRTDWMQVRRDVQMTGMNGKRIE